MRLEKLASCAGTGQRSNKYPRWAKELIIIKLLQRGPKRDSESRSDTPHPAHPAHLAHPAVCY